MTTNFYQQGLKGGIRMGRWVIGTVLGFVGGIVGVLVSPFTMCFEDEADPPKKNE